MSWIDDLYNVRNIRRLKRELKPLEEEQFRLATKIDDIRMWLIRQAESQFGVAHIDTILATDSKEITETKYLLLDKKLKHQQVTDKINRLRDEMAQSKYELGV